MIGDLRVNKILQEESRVFVFVDTMFVFHNDLF